MDLRTPSKERLPRIHRISAIPTPPEPYVAHPYTLLQSRELVGRQDELNALTDWITKPATTNDARIFCFVAIGGMGKSALTWKWFSQIAPNEMKPLAGRLWWSFYESDATFENFLIRALCYVSGEAEEVVRTRPWQDREALLLEELNDNPYLFVLDGLERILIAYNSMDASRLADDDYDKRTANWVTGAVGLPATAAQSFVGQHRLRQTTDPRAGAFLQRLAQVEQISHSGHALGFIQANCKCRPAILDRGASAYFLPGLSDDDAIDLWRALGVSGSRGELVPIFRSVDNHPLLVQALASEVANYKKTPGDFARWRDAHPQFDPTSLPLVKSRNHILQFAFHGLSDNSRKVLSMIVGFRMPANYASLEALLIGDNKALQVRARTRPRAVRTGGSWTDWMGSRGEPLRRPPHRPRRRVATHRQSTTSRRSTPHSMLISSRWRRRITSRSKSLAELTPAMERYNTLIGLGRYYDALDLFRHKLTRATLYRLSAHRERIALLERLFPHGTWALPTPKHESRSVLDAKRTCTELSDVGSAWSSRAAF